MTGLTPNFENKTALENYVYYHMILKKAKYQQGIFILFELLFMYSTFWSYWIGARKIIMPAMIFLVIKEIYIISTHAKRKALISFVGNFITACIMFVEEVLISYVSHITLFQALGFFVFETFLLPTVFTHISMFRYECIKESLSELKDYPYFFTHQYEPGTEVEFTEFDDSRNDKHLKIALRDIDLRNRVSKKLNIACIIGMTVGVTLMLTTISKNFSLKNAEEYSQEKYYGASESYVSIKLDFSSAIESSVGDNKNSYWIRLRDDEKYVYVDVNKKYFDELSDNRYPVAVKGKVYRTYEDEHINITRLVIGLRGKTHSELTSKDIEQIEEIARTDIYIDVVDEKSIDNILTLSLLLTLISFAVYTFSVTFIRKE
ncbi:MAG: hypothetical protein E7510_00560 [Ruminococcus sp.]|nr:hypothetical protein [Ruminococcus sp.]